MKWLCTLWAVLSWSFALLNLGLYAAYGHPLSLASGAFCTAMSVWTTYNVVRIWRMDRDRS